MILYKYAPLDGHTVENLRDSKLYFNIRENFNDPFDIYPKLDIEKEREPLLSALKKDLMYKYSPEFIETIDTLSDEEIFNTFHQKYTYNESSTKYGITCFSKIRGNILMWSHYADKHSGICMGFEIDEDDKCLKNFLDNDRNAKFLSDNNACKLFPIKYVDNNERPDFTFKEVRTENNDFMYKILSTKYKEWSYEQEVRIMVGNDKQGIFPAQIYYQPQRLKEIIFGARTSDEDISKVFKVLKPLPCFDLISFAQAKLNRYNYVLDIEPISKDESKLTKLK
ncbi:MAG: DUF2971 domain-containing protein [Selenomonadaceae bacterium]|nr:DUF2971 domain-containing protein [Selenomonadaceae bacterium]